MLPKHHRERAKPLSARVTATLQPILEFYEVSRDVFPGFVKDFVREYICPRARSWVPSSTKEGADALREILRKKKELYKIEVNDIGMTSAMSDFLAGKVSIKDVVDKLAALRNSQTQEIEKISIGRLEAIIPDLIESPVHPPQDTFVSTLQPSPAIIRNQVVTDKKLLIVDKQSPLLNNFLIFLAISERAFRESTCSFPPLMLPGLPGEATGSRSYLRMPQADSHCIMI